MGFWAGHILKTELDFCIDWGMADKEDYLFVMEGSPVRDIRIKYILKKVLTDKINDRETYLFNG